MRRQQIAEATLAFPGTWIIYLDPGELPTVVEGSPQCRPGTLVVDPVAGKIYVVDDKGKVKS